MSENDLKTRTRWAITHICKDRNFTNRSLASLLNIAVGNIAQYRSMNVRPSAEFMEKFCKQFGFSEGWFLSGIGEPFPGARIKHPEICGPADPLPGVHETKASYATGADQKVNIEMAMGKAYKVLSSGTALGAALYLNIEQFSSALETGHELKVCQDQIGGLQTQINDLRGQVDRLTADPTTAAEPGAGLEKKAV